MDAPEKASQPVIRWRMATFGLPEKPLAKYAAQFRSVEDPSTIGKLWTLLQVDLKELTSIVRNIQGFDISPNSLSFQVEDARIRAPSNPEPYFAQLKQVRLVSLIEYFPDKSAGVSKAV
jgi:hypothetical protein